MASEYLDYISVPDTTDYSDMPTLTRRSTRSFVESELDADLRELQLQQLESNTDSSFSDMLTSAGHHGLHLRTNMDLNNGGSSESMSSGASSVSSAYASTTASSAGGDTTSVNLADDGTFCCLLFPFASFFCHM